MDQHHALNFSQIHAWITLLSVVHGVTAEASSLRLCVERNLGRATLTRPLRRAVVKSSDVRMRALEGIEPLELAEVKVLSDDAKRFLRAHSLDSWNPSVEELAKVGQLLAHPRSGIRGGGGPFRVGPSEAAWIQEFSLKPNLERLQESLARLNTGAYDPTPALKERSLMARLKPFEGKAIHVANEFGNEPLVLLKHIDDQKGIVELEPLVRSGDGGMAAGAPLGIDTSRITVVELYERLGAVSRQTSEFLDLLEVLPESSWMQTIDREPIKAHARLKQSLNPSDHGNAEAQAHGILGSLAGYKGQHILGVPNRPLRAIGLGVDVKTVQGQTLVGYFSPKHLAEKAFSNEFKVSWSHRFRGPTALERAQGLANRRLLLGSHGTSHYTDHLLTLTGAQLIPKKAWDKVQTYCNYLLTKYRVTDHAAVKALAIEELERIATLFTEHLRNITVRLYLPERSLRNRENSLAAALKMTTDFSFEDFGAKIRPFEAPPRGVRDPAMGIEAARSYRDPLLSTLRIQIGSRQDWTEWETEMRAWAAQTVQTYTTR